MKPNALHLIFIFFPSVLFFGCTSDDQAYVDAGAMLVETGEVSFPLSDNMGFANYSLCHFEEDGKSYFSILNLLEPAVYVYSYESRDIVKRIAMQKEGPSGVGPTVPQCSHYMDKLSEFTYFSYRLGKAFRLDTAGNILKTFNFEQAQAAGIPNPSAFTYKPHVKLNDTLYVPAHPYDLKSGQLGYTVAAISEGDSAHYMFRLPDAYGLGTWNSMFAHIPNMAVNKKSNTLYVSYPIEGMVYAASSDSLIPLGMVESSHIESIPFLTDKTGNDALKAFSIDEMKEYSQTTPFYRSLIYDPYRDLFYRETLLKPTKEQYRNGEKFEERSLVLTDGNLNVIGETKLDSEVYDAKIFFVNEKGLHIAKIDRYRENEDAITFGILEVKPL